MNPRMPRNQPISLGRDEMASKYDARRNAPIIMAAATTNHLSCRRSSPWRVPDVRSERSREELWRERGSNTVPLC